LDNPIKVINARASKLTEDDVEWMVNELMDHFGGRIHSLSTYVYGSEKGVALAAFKEWARQTLKKGVETFLFKNEHWRTGRSIGPYLSTCLTKLADTLKSNIESVKKVSIPICPACKTLNEREFLVYEGKLMRCPTCTKEHERLEKKADRTSAEEYAYRLRKVFSLHSRKGRRCPSCERFIPESFINTSESGRVSCPYDNCSWFGIESELEPMAHPLGQSSGMTVSLNTPLSSKGWSSTSETEMGDMIDAKEVNPDIRMEQAEKYHKEMKIAREVLSVQKSRLERMPRKKVIKKYLMYQAFQNLLDQDPAAMISYLIHGKSLGERPIQSLIFQHYIQLVENNLPFTVDDEDGEEGEVYSLLDSKLNLFLGTSEYQAYVRESGLVSNNTHEVFVGAKCNGPCFIGLLCDVQTESGKSLLSEVEYYTFSSVKMKSTVPQNTLVKVIHFRIPPHYEMYSLVNLQRVRRKIVDSIYKRLHGETRPLKGSDECKTIPEISR
jgi:Pyruvate/2-oxoacid:ferredoxin oxidoreductase delta subunit